MEFQNKREHTLWLIEQGGATNEIIEETVGISNKSRGTIFAQLRLMGKYPMADENGVYRIGTADEFEAKKAAAAANRKPTKTLTPEETPRPGQEARSQRCQGSDHCRRPP